MKEMFWDKNIILFSITLFFFAYEPGDSALFEYQIIKVYSVKPFILALAQVLSFSMIILSSLAFRSFFRNTKPVVVVTATTIVLFGLIFSRNLFITKRIIVEINSFFIGNVIVSSFFGHLSFMPLAIISTTLCKKGAEATMYAYFMSITNFAGIISRELSGFLSDKIGIRKQLEIETSKVDLFYIICIILDFIGLIVVFVLLLKININTKETREIELREFETPCDDFTIEELEDTNGDLVEIPLEDY